jgi:hypothetical protein
MEKYVAVLTHTDSDTSEKVKNVKKCIGHSARWERHQL